MCIRFLPLSGQDAIGAEFASNPSHIMGRHEAFTACERFAMGDLRRVWREIRSADIAPFREGDDQQWRDLKRARYGDGSLADDERFAICPTIEQAWHKLSGGID